MHQTSDEDPDEEIYYFSQLGQDYWLINQAFRERREGFFVDVGAFQMTNGYMSNTLAGTSPKLDRYTCGAKPGTMRLPISAQCETRPLDCVR